MSLNLSFREQIRRNTVALISLVIAITSLGYNTWRNEASEDNRNQRLVSIQVLVMLGELQLVILDRRFGKEVDGRSNLRKGWALALTIQDISMVANGDIPESAEQLFNTWTKDSDDLGSSDEARRRIEEAVARVRHATHEVLRSLD